MKKIFISLLFVIISGSTVLAQGVDTGEVTSEEVYTFPVIKPEVSTFGGYRFVDLSGSERADEYEYLHDSISLGGEARIFSFPHRFHLDLDLKDRKDYFSDISYSYKDIVQFRWINRTLFHNLDNIRLIDLDPATPSPGVDARDMDEKYGVKVGMNTVFLRFKTPDYPFHIYAEGSLVEKDGTQQQRSLLGAGYFNDIVRTSQSRNIDWQTRNLVIGVNSHLGPIEVDISHGEKRFTAGGDTVLYDTYSAAGSPPGSTRAAGVFPHNLIPDLTGSSNTIKIHTSYTGSIVAAATISKTDRKNEDSGARAGYFMGAGEVTWMLTTRLAFFLNYRHKEADIDNPGSITIADISNPANTYTYQVRPSISSMTDTVSGVLRYRPISFLTLRTEYSYENIHRKNAHEWNIPDSTKRDILSLSADTRILKGVNLRARYIHKEIDNPAYNIEPNRCNEGRVSVSWIPIPRINTLLSYSIVREKRNDLYYDGVQDAGDRDAKRDRLLGSITFLILKNLSLTTSYAYMHNKVTQDIVYGSSISPFPELLDPAVPYKDMAHNYAIDVNYMPKNNITVNAGISYSISSGMFYPNSQDLLQPVSVASFSELKLRETVYSASGEYRFRNGFAAGLQLRYTVVKDVLDNPNDDLNNGKAHIILLTLSKRW